VSVRHLCQHESDSLADAEDFVGTLIDLSS